MRVFAVRSQENPEMLTEVVTSNVTIADSQEGNTVHLEFENKKFDIEYPMNSGYIYKVSPDKDLAMLSLQLSAVDEPTILTVTVPKRLLYQVFSCGEDPYLMSPDHEVEGYIDSIPITTPFFRLGDPSWQINVDAGSAEISFTGVCLA